MHGMQEVTGSIPVFSTTKITAIAMVFFCYVNRILRKSPVCSGKRGFRLSKKQICIHFHRRTCADDENTARVKNRVRVAVRHENVIFCDRVNPKEGCRSVAQPHCDEPLLCACRVSQHTQDLLLYLRQHRTIPA